MMRRCKIKVGTAYAEKQVIGDIAKKSALSPP